MVGIAILNICLILLVLFFAYKFVYDMLTDIVSEHIDFLTDKVNDNTKPEHKKCWQELSDLYSNPNLLNLIKMYFVVKRFEKKMGLTY